jgi:hypothetical protein
MGRMAHFTQLKLDKIEYRIEIKSRVILLRA